MMWNFSEIAAEFSAASNEAVDILLSTFNLTSSGSLQTCTVQLLAHRVFKLLFPGDRAGGELFFGKAEGFNSSEFSLSARGQVSRC